MLRIEEIEHSLSRLAIAKAIKTPLDGESNAEPWNKSIIFNQPFIKELHKQRQQLQRQREAKPENGQMSIREQRPRYQHARQQSTSTSSQVSGNESPRNPKWQQHTCLPSDSEDDEESEDDSSVSEDEDADKPDLSFYKLERPSSVPKITTSPTMSRKSRHSPPSLTGSSSDGLASSPSSYTAPLTDDSDEQELDYSWLGVIEGLSVKDTFHPLQQQAKKCQQRRMNSFATSNAKDATPNANHVPKLSYQQYLQQLQYQQQQLQFQQLLHHQSQQQLPTQQYYPAYMPYPVMLMMPAPTPSNAPMPSPYLHPAQAYYYQHTAQHPPHSRQLSSQSTATTTTSSSVRSSKRASQQSTVSNNNNAVKNSSNNKTLSHSKHSSTDLRRREEMMMNNPKRNSASNVQSMATMPRQMMMKLPPLQSTYVQNPTATTTAPSSHLRKGGRYASYIL